MLDVIEEKLVGNLFDRSTIIGKDNAAIGLCLFNNRRDFAGYLPHSGLWRDAREIAFKSINRGSLFCCHNFGIKGARDIKRVDIGEYLAHCVNEGMHQTIIRLRMGSIEHDYTSRREVIMDLLKKLFRRELKGNI